MHSNTFGDALSFMDDTSFVGTEVSVAKAVATYQAELGKIGLSVNADKSFTYLLLYG